MLAQFRSANNIPKLWLVRGEAIMGWDLDETARYIVSTLNRWKGEVLKHTFPTNPFSEQQQKDNGV